MGQELLIIIKNLKGIENPKKYLNKICNLEHLELIKTIASFMVVLTIIKAIISNDNIAEIEVWNQSLISTLLSLRYFPVFMIMLIFKKNIKIGKKIITSIYFSVIYINLLLIIPSISFIIFKKTELYFFYYFTLSMSFIINFYIIIYLPFKFNERFRRIITIIFTTVVFFLINFITIYGFTYFNNSQYLIIDPIESEFFENQISNKMDLSYFINNAIICNKLLINFMNKGYPYDIYEQEKIVVYIDEMIEYKDDLIKLKNSLIYKKNTAYLGSYINLLEKYEQFKEVLDNIDFTILNNTMSEKYLLESDIEDIKILLQNDNDTKKELEIFNKILIDHNVNKFSIEDYEKAKESTIKLLKTQNENYKLVCIYLEKVKIQLEQLDKILKQINSQTDILNNELIIKTKWIEMKSKFKI